MIIANVDTPWAVNSDGANVPKLGIDLAFVDLIKGWTDVTGVEGVIIGSRRLYGGNYAKSTGIQPDYPAGRVGGSGDPDWLTVQIKVENEQTLIDIDAEQEYWVYWDEIEEEPGATRAAAESYKPKDEEPPANEWGLLRSRLAQRGYSQEWIDSNLGTQRERTRGVHDYDVRQGYLTDQSTVNLVELTQYLIGQGWDATGGAVIVIHDSGVTYEVAIAWLLGCDYSSLNNGPLEHDIKLGMQTQGFCLGEGQVRLRRRRSKPE